MLEHPWDKKSYVDLVARSFWRATRSCTRYKWCSYLPLWQEKKMLDELVSVQSLHWHYQNLCGRETKQLDRSIPPISLGQGEQADGTNTPGLAQESMSGCWGTMFPLSRPCLSQGTTSQLQQSCRSHSLILSDLKRFPEEGINAALGIINYLQLPHFTILQCSGRKAYLQPLSGFEEALLL